MGEGTVGDRTICTLAVVKALFDREQSFLGYLEPFLEHCMHEAEFDQISVVDLQAAIRATFGLHLPQGVIKTLLRRQEAKGHVSIAKNVCLIERDRLVDADLDADRKEAMRRQAALVGALIAYAAGERFAQRWDEDRARDRLLAYVEQFSARVFQATMGKGMPKLDHESARDQHVVHTFVLHALEKDQVSFEFLTDLVKGQMLADAIYLEPSEIQEGAEPLSELEVYLDTPILLRALGYMGEELVAPYLELLELLERQDALVRCFETNIEEAQRIFAQAARASEPGGERMQGDVFKHLARIEATPSDIAMMSRRLPTDLLRLKIQPVELPRTRPRHGIDEEALERALMRRIPAYRRRPLETDVRALAAVHGLRRGASARTLPRSKAVFVTRNYNLYKVSKEFFQQRDPDEEIPPCIPMSAFTTMVWVREPLGAPDLPRNRVIADAVAAMRPSEELWRAFDEEVDQLRKSDDISADDAHHLRVDFESEQALMDTTLGDEQAYVEGTARQVFDRALENERFASERRHARIEKNARRTGRIAAKLLFAVVIPLLLIGAIFGTLGVFSGSPLPGFLQWPATVLFAVLSILSFIDGISFHSRAKRTAERLEGLAVGIALRFLEAPAET